MKRLVCLVAAACSGAQTPPLAEVAPGAKGSLGKRCGDVAFYVSSGTDAGQCRAEVDDRTLAMKAMSCDDGNGNRAALACSEGRVTCKAVGSGLCAADEGAVRPGTRFDVTTSYFAHRCGLATYVVAPGTDKGICLGTFDRATGTRSMHCDDGAGDTATFTCRDGTGACAATGTGLCGADEALVRKPKK